MNVNADQFARVLMQLLTLYMTAGIMSVGFGLMLGGPEKAASIARFFFVRPLELLRSWVLHLLSRVCQLLLHLVVLVIGSLAKFFAYLWQHVARALSWLAAREAGWAEPYLRAAWQKIWP